MRVLINADDFGMSEKIDEGIIEVASKGMIDSLSVSVINDLNFSRLEKLRQVVPTLSLGLHLNLTEGLHKLTALEQLSQEKNLRVDHFLNEMGEQLHAFRKSLGHTPHHLDSHQHFTYLSPTAFEAMLVLAQNEQIPIRSPIPFLNRLKIFAHELKKKRNISLPFDPKERELKLQNILSHYQINFRSDDVHLDLHQTEFPIASTLEIICHPSVDNREEFKRLFALQLVLKRPDLPINLTASYT